MKLKRCVLCGCYNSGDKCELASTFYKYDLRGKKLVLSCATVRRVSQGSISLELLMCGGAVRSILLLSLVVMCIETIDVCIWRMFAFMTEVMTLCGMFVIVAGVKDSEF